jgi:hypothetical protein
MAKKELNFGKLGLPQKATIIKKEEETPNIEKAIEKIHGEPQKGRVEEATREVTPTVEMVETPPPTPAAKTTSTKAKAVAKVVEPIETTEATPVRKISMDLPLEVYKYLKINSFEQAITMKDYVLRLIEADMKKK